MRPIEVLSPAIAGSPVDPSDHLEMLEALEAGVLESRMAVSAIDVAPNVGFLQTLGYETVGDGGKALYSRAAEEPEHGFKFQSGDGAWWEGRPGIDGLNVKALGAGLPSITDHAPAIQAGLDFVMSNGGALVFPFEQGERYEIQQELIIDYSRVGTQTNMVWLRGTGNPDRNTGGALHKNMIIWTGAAGGTMLRLINPLDQLISDIGLHGNDLADYCIHQSNVEGGWGHVHAKNISLQGARKNLLRYTGAVDGGRNLWQGCTFRKSISGDAAGAHNNDTGGALVWTLTDDPDLADVQPGAQMYVAAPGTTTGSQIYTIVSVDNSAKTVTVSETDAPAVASGSPVAYAIAPGLPEDEALCLYDGANNVADAYVDCELIYTAQGYSIGHAFHVKSGSPDIYLRGGFVKTYTDLFQSDGAGAAFFSANDLYSEGERFHRDMKQVDQNRFFSNVRHAGSGVFSELSGLSSGRVLKISGGFTNGKIVVTNRDDFPIIKDGFDLRSGVVELDNSIGPRTNLIEIGRSAAIAKTHSWIAAGGFISRLPNADTDGNLNVNLANGSIFFSSRVGGASVAVLDPANVTAIEDDGARITIVLHANGVSAISVSWGLAYLFEGGTAPTSVDGNKYTIVEFLNIGGGIWLESARRENIG